MGEDLPNYDQIKQIVDQIVNRTMQMDMTWDWGTGVAYHGICKAYEEFKDDCYLNLLKERIDELMEYHAGKAWNVNQCAMGHCLINLYQETGESKYWDLVMSKIDYLRNNAPRFGDNILQHTVSSKNDFPEQAWADTLFMAAFFMLRVGVITKDEALIEDALNQYYGHIHYLQDRQTGLFFHGYDNQTKGHMSGFYWGRANAWAAYTMSQVGRHLPEAYLYPKFMDILGSLGEQLSALKYLQTEKGLWRTLLDDEKSYEEISASAGIAAAMIAWRNPLHQKHIKRSISGLLENITEDGRVLNVSGGTAIMRDKEGYLTISKDWLQGWGQGLALVCLAEFRHYNLDK